MDINIIDKNFSLTLYGISGAAVNRNWIETGFKLMDEMWKQVKAGGLKHKGMNVWVYEDDNKMFAGVEIEGAGADGTTLEPKTINLPKYAYYKHIGPYKHIRSAGSKVLDELERKGIKTCLPYIEIYGHWTADETKLETELLWCLK